MLLIIVGMLILMIMIKIVIIAHFFMAQKKPLLSYLQKFSWMF